MKLTDATLLLSLTIRKMAETKRDNAVTGEVINRKDALDKKSGGWNTRLFPGKPNTKSKDRPLGKINQKSTEIRNLYYQYTHPWTNDGQRILPVTAFHKWRNDIKSLRNEWDDLVKDFIANYDESIEQSKITLGNLFDPSLYPCKSELEYLFDVTWDYQPLPTARDFRIDLVEEDLDEVKESLNGQLKEAEKAIAADLFHRLSKPLKFVVEKLSNEDSTFKKTTIENIESAINIVQLLDVSECEELRELCGKIKTDCCIDPKEIREDKELRKQVVSKAREHLSGLDVLFGG